MDNTAIEDLKIQDRFILAGQTYTVYNIETDAMNDYVVVAQLRGTGTTLKLIVEPRTPFTTLG